MPDAGRERAAWPDITAHGRSHQAPDAQPAARAVCPRDDNHQDDYSGALLVNSVVPPRRRLCFSDTRSLMNYSGYRATKAWERGNDDEQVKPLDGIQLVQIQPGQRRSGQAGSESCTCAGRPAR
jgi:hypothetical protein